MPVTTPMLATALNVAAQLQHKPEAWAVIQAVCELRGLDPLALTYVGGQPVQTWQHVGAELLLQRQLLEALL